jgi:RNA polymerase sigma factor (sigma-70 family)
LEVNVDATIDNPNGPFDEDKQRLLAAVLQLQKSEQQVVMLRYFDGHSVKDVAEIVGRSVGTVTKQLSRAYKSLRRLLERSEL